MIAKRSRMLPSYDPKTDAALAYGRETSVQLLRRIDGEDGGSKRAMALSTRQLGRMAPPSGIEALWFFLFFGPYDAGTRRVLWSRAEMRGVDLSRMCDEKGCMSRIAHGAHEQSRMLGRRGRKKRAVEKIHNCGSCARNTHVVRSFVYSRSACEIPAVGCYWAVGCLLITPLHPFLFLPLSPYHIARIHHRAG